MDLSDDDLSLVQQAIDNGTGKPWEPWERPEADPTDDLTWGAM